jgi:starch synthase
LHNVSAQGIFPFESTFAKTGFPEESKKIFEHKGQFNFLKAGIMYADHITTVSPSYGQQILEDEELTNGLNILLKERVNDFTPIINGIDTTTWDPARDKHIKKTYSIESLDRKMLNKQALVNEFKLSYHENIPVIALLSRLVPQKGIEIVMEAAEMFLQRNVQFVVLGEGEKRFEDFFTNLAKKYPTKVAFKKSFDEVMAHKVEAGADIYLMPSLFEPCGLNQMYSCVYGTVPVVRATGGLRDTITEFDSATKKGNGFLFEEFSGTALVGALTKALDAFTNRPLWQQLIRNCMASDFSWTTSAKQYADIYRRLLDQ